MHTTEQRVIPYDSIGDEADKLHDLTTRASKVNKFFDAVPALHVKEVVGTKEAAEKDIKFFLDLRLGYRLR